MTAAGLIAPATAAAGSDSALPRPVGVDFTPQRMALWLGALALLWLVLAALADSGNANVARALGGLVVAGALLALGPGAIDNAKNMFSEK